MTLFGNTVLLAPLTQKSQSDGGILYAPQYRDDQKQWQVLAVGPGKRARDGTRIPVELRPGQRCLFDPGHGTKYSFDDGRVLADADTIEMVWE